MSQQRLLSLRKDVRLAPLSLEHAANMYRWMCNPEISKNVGLRSAPSLEKTIDWINSALRDPLTQPYAVLLNDQHVGNVILDQIDHYLDSARLSVYIGESTARQSGVGRTAIYLTLVEGFKKMNLHKIWLTVHDQNFLAINTYTRLGFVLEGILRDEFWLDGERIPVLYLGLVRHDFERIAERY